MFLNFANVQKKILVIQILSILFYLNVFAEDKKITQIKSSKVNVQSFTSSVIKLKIEKEPKDSKRLLSYKLIKKPEHGDIVMPKPHKKYYYSSGGRAFYTSKKDFVGKDSIQWQLNDSVGNSKIVTVDINVVPAIPEPLTLDTSLTVENQEVNIPIKFIGGGGYQYQIQITQPANGTVKMTTGNQDFIYTPNKSFSGSDKFTWRIAYTRHKKKILSKMITTWIITKKKGQQNWPQWRADGWRSGFTTMELPKELHLQWSRNISQIRSSFTKRHKTLYKDIDYCRPVQMGKSLYITEPSSDSLSAYNTDTGKRRWRFFASGPTRRPALVFKHSNNSDAVIFSSEDGWVYCLKSTDGSIIWKFQGAPNNRKAMGFGRLSSAWPVLASPVFSKGKIYFTAGFIPTFGLYAYCLDAKTGKVNWVNDGRIDDIWNTSAYSPLALSFDNSKIFGAVEGASRPWVLDSKNGAFLGHIGVGYTFPGSGKYGHAKKFYPYSLREDQETMRNGHKGWFVNGSGDFNISAPVDIKVGSRYFTRETIKTLGVTGTVASLLAGDKKLFVTTAKGDLFCFSGKTTNKPLVLSDAKVELPVITDQWTHDVKNILSSKNLKQGLVLVLGIKDGRMVEELVKQSSLMIVAVDENQKTLQQLRKKLLSAGYPAKRFSTLQGNPFDFQFSPYQAVLICSEKRNILTQNKNTKLIINLYQFTHPFGGEIWLPGNDKQFSLITQQLEKYKNKTFYKVLKQNITNDPEGLFTKIIRTGLTQKDRNMKPPFGLIAFGSQRSVGPSNKLNSKFGGLDTFNWLTRKSHKYEFNSFKQKQDGRKGYPSISTVSTSQSIFSSMKNPLYSRLEKFVGLPGTKSDGACSMYWLRFGDYGLTHGKIASIFDASSNYWGRLIFPQIGGCPGRLTAGNGIFTISTTPVPGSTCGCSAAMQFSDFSISPLRYEENWVNFQRRRSSEMVEEIAIKKIGINFGAPGDRFIPEEDLLWTHHPYAGRYGYNSHNYEVNPEALPLIPVSYKGKVQKIYHHSAQMHRNEKRYRGWVAASYVKGMSEINIPLAQSLVAIKAKTPPKIDGVLDDDIWKNASKVVFTANKINMDNDRIKLPGAKEECSASFRYDDTNLYIGVSTNAIYGISTNFRNKKYVKITLNSRERIVDDIIMIGSLEHNRRKQFAFFKKSSQGIKPDLWNCQLIKNEKKPFSAEFMIPWKSISSAGLWKEQLIVNIELSRSQLTPNYMPLYLDKVRSTISNEKKHTVRLYFGEMEDKKNGERVFDVSLQDKIVINKLDVIKESGSTKKQLIKEFKNINIADKLKITFKAISGQPMISGVEIIGDYKKAYQQENIKPNAMIKASVLSGPTPLRIYFSARESTDLDGQIAQCTWDLGDGRLAKGSKISHVFAEKGTYKVHLLVRDNRGGVATKNITINVTSGKPAAFICKINTKGGDFATLSEWEKALKSDMTFVTKRFKVTSKIKSRFKYTSKDNGAQVTFKNGATGIIKSLNKDIATITDIQGKPDKGWVTIKGRKKFIVGDKGISAGLSLIFKVKSRGSVKATDYGKKITFTGNGTGILRFINSQNLAYITDCKGTTTAGTIKCASSNTFEISDTGNAIYSIVAECYGNMTDHLKTTEGWECDSTRSVTIRSASRNYKGFHFKGNLDLSTLTHLRMATISMDSTTNLSTGKGSSINRIQAGKVRTAENSIVANSIAESFSAFNSRGIINHSYSYYSKGGKNISREIPYAILSKVENSHISFYNCTAKTFDPGNQGEVEFINCLTAPGGKGFYHLNYSEPAFALNCISNNESSQIWDKESGTGNNKIKLSTKFIDASLNDYHLNLTDKTASKQGSLGLGADIDGDERKGMSSDVGADSIK